MDSDPYNGGYGSWDRNAENPTPQVFNTTLHTASYLPGSTYEYSPHTNHQQQPQAKSYEDATQVLLHDDESLITSLLLSSQHSGSHLQYHQQSSVDYSDIYVNPTILNISGNHTVPPILMPPSDDCSTYNAQGQFQGQERYFPQVNGRDVPTKNPFLNVGPTMQAGVANDHTIISTYSCFDPSQNRPQFDFKRRHSGLAPQCDDGDGRSVDQPFNMNMEVNDQAFPEQHTHPRGFLAEQTEQQQHSFQRQVVSSNYSMPVQQAQSLARHSMAEANPLNGKSRGKAVSHSASTQVQSVKCREKGCTRNYRETYPGQQFCTRHQDKHDRRNAPDAKFRLMKDITSEVAHLEVYPTYSGIKPTGHDGTGDDVDPALEEHWMEELIAAVSKPYTGGAENEDFRKRQQGVYNGKRYDNRNVNVRLRLLYQAALIFHRGGKAVYPRGGDNDGYGNPDESLIFSERMDAITKILEEDKRVCMDIIEGRGVTALVANPLKYEKRKTQNKQSNETKQKKQQLGEKVEAELRRKDEANTCGAEGDDPDSEDDGDLDADSGPATISRGRKRKRASKPTTAKGKMSTRSKESTDEANLQWFDKFPYQGDPFSSADPNIGARAARMTRSQTGQSQPSEQQRVATAAMPLGPMRSAKEPSSTLYSPARHSVVNSRLSSMIDPTLELGLGQAIYELHTDESEHRSDPSFSQFEYYKQMETATETLFSNAATTSPNDEEVIHSIGEGGESTDEFGDIGVWES